MTQSAPAIAGGFAPAAPFTATNVGAGTVFGIQLEPGERVVRYEAYSYTGEKIANWVLFALTFWILLGFWFLYQALVIEKKSAKGFAVTTKRIIVGANENFNGGQPLVIELGRIADLEPVRRNVNAGGGGLLGAAISAGATAIANGMANKADKTTKKYWARAEDITVICHDGVRQNLGTVKNTVDAGMFLAQGMAGGGFDACPDVAFG